MIIKKSKAEILNVMTDEEHNIDDEGTRKSMKQAEDKSKKKLTNAEQNVN